MKIFLITLLASIFYTNSFGQIQHDEQNRVYYQKVFVVEGEKESLREKANAWLVKKFDNTNRGIKMNTSDNLIGKGNFDGELRDGLGRLLPAKFNYTLEISFKEGRYRMTINQLTQKFTHPDLPPTEVQVVYPFDNPEKYVAYQKELIEATYSGLLAKSALKRLEKPNKVEKDMERQWKYYEVVEPQIKSHFKNLSESLYDYIKNDNNSDDW